MARAMRRWIFPMALALLVAAWGCRAFVLEKEAAAAPQGLVLVRDGQPLASIVLPAETEFDRFVEEKTAWVREKLRETHPDVAEAEWEKLFRAAVRPVGTAARKVGDEEELAAEELQSVIEKISGARLPIVRVEGLEVPEGRNILLGAALARGAGLGESIEALDTDGLVCRVAGDSLILSGRRARGTLYAVYTFLESLGCRWVMPGEFGELYPSMKTIATDVNATQNPSHSQRYFWCTYGHEKEYPRWTLRNKGNFVTALGDVRVHQGHALAGPLRWGAGQEKYRVKVVRKVPEQQQDADGSTVTMMVEKEVDGLPDEYYAMRGGEPLFSTPNMAKPDVWEMYADYYIQYFSNNPLEEYVSMSAEDGLVVDERLESRAIDSLEIDPCMGMRSATDRMWFFFNRVIERVAEVHPDKKFGILVYSNNITAPRLERVHRNMALVFAPLTVSPLHHVRDPRSKTNRHYRQWLEDWMLQAGAAGAESYYYDYEPMGYCWNMAMICPRWGIIGKNYPWFHELGLTGHTTQGYDDWAACGLDNYLMQRLYWDVRQPYREIIADYARARFGAAAEAIIDYCDVLEQRLDEIPDLYSNEVWDNHLILTPEVRARCRRILARAEKLADTERAKAHVATMVDLQRSTDAMCDAIELARESGDFGKAAQMMRTCFDVRDKLNELYPNFMNKVRLSDEQKAPYMTGGLYNQYVGFGEKIDGAAASLLLPRYWKGMLDTRNHAAPLGYHKPEVSVKDLEELDITVCADVKYNTQRQPAAFFYRAEVAVPKSFEGRQKITIFYPGLIARALQIWINGEPVEFDSVRYAETVWRGPERFWMDYHHDEEFDVTPYILPGEKNTIAFRIFKSYEFGGTYRRAFLLGY